MSKKKDAYYFDNFIACAELACREAHLLKEVLKKFQPDDVADSLAKLHEVEHRADEKKHEMTDMLTDAFITPIDREDITALSGNIDDVTDRIEEVFLRVYMNNVREIRPEAFPMVDVVIECCEDMRNLLQEFRNFRRSTKRRALIININTLEEKADALFLASMRKLHTEEKDLRQVLAWREIYTYLEQCSDACEHVADVVGSVTMKNS